MLSNTREWHCILVSWCFMGFVWSVGTSFHFGRSTVPVHIRKKTLLVGFNEGAAPMSSVHANGVPLLILCGCFVFSLYLSLERERELCNIWMFVLAQSHWASRWVCLNFMRDVWSLSVYLNIVILKHDEIQLTLVTRCFFIYICVCSIDK